MQTIIVTYTVAKAEWNVVRHMILNVPDTSPETLMTHLNAKGFPEWEMENENFEVFIVSRSVTGKELLRIMDRINNEKSTISLS